MQTVLLIEDNHQVLASTADALVAAGFDVIAAANWEQATHARSVRTDIALVLSDWNLNDRRTGLELCLALRESGLLCPYVLTSGSELPPEETLPEWMGYLPKPFTREALLAAIVDSRQPA